MHTSCFYNGIKVPLPLLDLTACSLLGHICTFLSLTSISWSQTEGTCWGLRSNHSVWLSGAERLHCSSQSGFTQYSLDLKSLLFNLQIILQTFFGPKHLNMPQSSCLAFFLRQMCPQSWGRTDFDFTEYKSRCAGVEMQIFLMLFNRPAVFFLCRLEGTHWQLKHEWRTWDDMKNGVDSPAHVSSDIY